MVIGLFCVLLLPGLILAGGVKGGDSKGGGCVYSEWSQWSSCSVTCGDGLQNRVRNLISGPFCQITSETRACNSAPCVVKSDCVMSEWSQWSVCNKQCGTGRRERTRNINKPAVGGAACETTVEVQTCNTQACGVDCAVGDWGVWSSCSANCNGGKRTRTRPITVGPSNGGAPCPATQESQDCNPQPCPVDCVLSDWSSWSSCSVSCGGGRRTRTRIVTRQPAAGGKACETLSQEEVCNVQACPIDCAVTSWGAWSSCSKPCGGGITQRARSIFSQPSAGGKACPNTVEVVNCNTQACSVDCVMSQWGQWSKCSTSCGGGRTERTRTITVQASNGGRACEATSEVQVCNAQPCPVDCVMSAWSDWSKCSVSCGGGRREQVRTITVQASNGGKSCEVTAKYEECNVLPCPVDCVMSQWSEWSKCSVSCGGGRREATRTITVQASNGGRACETTLKYENCNTQPCPVDCVMGTWSDWSKCSTSCGGGRRESVRAVTVQAAFGGKSCESTVKYEDCNIQPCPVDCVMSEWGQWSQCSVSCGIGRREQRRTITTAASFGGKACDITSKFENCNTQACPVDCVMGPWSEWSKCSASCGGGRREKVRSVSVQAAFGGKACDLSVQYEACNSQPCAVDCVMGSWSQWSQCSASCGGGRRESIRTVSVQAANGGKACEATVKYEDCNVQKCAVDCVMGAWSQWSQCSASCGGGRRESVRNVAVAAANGGKACEDTVKYETCNTQTCAVDCVMGPWSDYSVCSVTCGGGRRERVRKVITPASGGGKPCEATIFIDECASKACAVDCVMGPWSQWGVCSKTCGNGQQARSRAVATPASNGGAQCPPTIEVQTCASVPCPGVPPPPPVPVPVPSVRPQNPSQGAFNPNEPVSSPSQPSWNDVPAWNQPPAKGGVKGGGKKGLISTNDQPSRVFSTAPFLGGIGAGVFVVAVVALVVVLVRRPSRQQMEVGVGLL